MHLVTIGLSLLATIVSGFVLHISGLIALDTLEFYALISMIFISYFALLAIVLLLALRPLSDLMAAIVHISGEKHSTPPPNPNQVRYEKTGMDEALKTLYALASTKDNVDTKYKKKKDAKINLNQALDSAQTELVVLDKDSHIVYASKGAPLQTMQGKLSMQLLFHGNDTLEDWLAQCKENAIHAENIWARIPDRPADQEGQKIYDVLASYEKDTEYETVITLVDRTHTYSQDEEDLNFIAFAAHELRGPITVIRGYLDVLQMELEDTLEHDQAELFQRLTVSASRLSGYVNNILNTSRYDRRHLRVNLTEDSLATIYSTIRDDMTLRARAQNRLLHVNIPDDLPTIPADRSSLTEVFGNLIDNAIKYSNEGGTVSVSAEQKGDFVELSVEDHGIGMPPSVVKNLFQKFYRSHRSRETVAGSGIGLYIAKAITESHGGNISVHSAEGEGSTFTVSLPTYASVAHKLQNGDNSNEELIKSNKGWIKNHSMYRG